MQPIASLVGDAWLLVLEEGDALVLARVRCVIRNVDCLEGQAGRGMVKRVKGRLRGGWG
jgi:hypothetical protein